MATVLDIATDQSATPDGDAQVLPAAWSIAPRPATITETGLSHSYLADLVVKHLLAGGALTISELAKRLHLAGSVVEEMIIFLREQARIEVLGASIDAMALRYALTDRGRNFALDATLRSGYCGPAPVPLDTYAEIVRVQSIHGQSVSREMMERLFANVVIDPKLRDQLGLSMNSGRAIFIYGPAGTGKTYITSKLAHLFDDAVLIPYAINIGDSTVAVFDPIVHKVTEADAGSGWMLDEGFDPRFAHCERPVIVVGGELTADMLDVHYDSATKEYMAPLQLKANNGVFIIDDMGRQRVPPETIFNRWIVPMEEKTDYLTLGAGKHFRIPFDEVLIFSTNMNPTDLADEAFLRRIGYKVEFQYLTEDAYRAIWAEVCSKAGIDCNTEVVDFVINDLHRAKGTPLAPCHPRDLIGIAMDHMTYAGGSNQITADHVQMAWDSYFVSLNENSNASEQAADQR